LWLPRSYKPDPQAYYLKDEGWPAISREQT
jgi:hypothetical protein